jgi:hypothetical protein
MLGAKKGGRVRAYLIEANGELSLVDTLFENDARGVLDAIRRLGHKPSDLKRIVLTHAHRSHLGGLAALKKLSGATVYAHEWEADIVAGERRAQAVTILPKQSLRLMPFQLGLWLNRLKHHPCPPDETLDDGDAFGPLQVLHAAGTLPGTSCVLVARASLSHRRRRGRDVAGGLRRLDGVQPQPPAAPRLAAADGVTRAGHRRRRPRRSDHAGCGRARARARRIATPRAPSATRAAASGTSRKASEKTATTVTSASETIAHARVGPARIRTADASDSR